MKSNNFTISIIGLALLIIVPVCAKFGIGAGGFGPRNQVTAVVVSKHVDSGKESSSYMVSTDKGTFEVDNGLLLWTFNADEIYGSIQVGHKYRFTTEGKKTVNFLFQIYPYIIRAQEVD
jgi:hypothetical protein